MVLSDNFVCCYIGNSIPREMIAVADLEMHIYDMGVRYYLHISDMKR